MAEALGNASETIFKANQEDLHDAVKAGLASALVKRLKFDRTKLNSVIAGVNALITLNDPIGEQIDGVEARQRPDPKTCSLPDRSIGDCI